MQKTIKEWLETLPEPYRSRALKNHAEKPIEFHLGAVVGDIQTAVSIAFIWLETEEGYHYWKLCASDSYPDADEPRTYVVLPQDELPETPIPELKSNWPTPQPISDFPTGGPSETYATDGTIVFEKQHQEPFIQTPEGLMSEGQLKHLAEGLTERDAIQAEALDRTFEKIREKLNALPPKSNPVNHPSHYTKGDVECIDALAAATIDLTGMEAVCTANAIKYLWRWKHKNGVEDLRKAKFYIDKLINELEK